MLRSFQKLLFIEKNSHYFNTIFTRKRSMSISETSIALRPFIFRVHPDLCTKYAVEKAKTNEESLKQLNDYIHKLHNKEAVQPLKLVFHLRRLPSSLETNIPEMRTVHIHLQSTSIVDTICSILKTCKLPLDYLERIGVNKHAVVNNGRQKVTFEWTSTQSEQDLWKILWKYESGMHYSKTDDQVYGEVHTRHHAETSINKWFKQNLKKAGDNSKKVQPLRDEIARLKALLMEELGLVDIEWQSGWTLSAFNTALKGLEKVASKSKEDLDLKGRTLIFSNELGLSVNGDIILPQDTVSDAWIYILKSLTKYDKILSAIPRYEWELRELLFGVRILPPQQSLVLAVNYLDQLKWLVDSIKEYKVETGGRIMHDVSKLQVSVECTTGPLMMTESGQIMVPMSCPAFLIFDYINRHAEEAIRLHSNFIKSQVSDESIISLCQSALKLRMLTQDSSITRQQMVFCCKRLLKLKEAGRLNADISSAWVRVGQFYTVTLEGEMCIPWNFEDKI